MKGIVVTALTLTMVACGAHDGGPVTSTSGESSGSADNTADNTGEGTEGGAEPIVPWSFTGEGPGQITAVLELDSGQVILGGYSTLESMLSVPKFWRLDTQGELVSSWTAALPPADWSYTLARTTDLLPTANGFVAAFRNTEVTLPCADHGLIFFDENLVPTKTHRFEPQCPGIFITLSERFGPSLAIKDDDVYYGWAEEQADTVLDSRLARFTQEGDLLSDSVWDIGEGNDDAIVDLQVDSSGELRILVETGWLTNTDTASWLIPVNADLTLGDAIHVPGSEHVHFDRLDQGGGAPLSGWFLVENEGESARWFRNFSAASQEEDLLQTPGLRRINLVESSAECTWLGGNTVDYGPILGCCDEQDCSALEFGFDSGRVNAMELGDDSILIGGATVLTGGNHPYAEFRALP